ncbi:MAG: hypothetical protein RMJ98_21235 [Myxococcales bacterium]|nr:hypothetical protein [Polyangiaceae bacterium]MDW8251829.1 hypothetical protein [Myxococcales bacterium]
MSSPSRKTRRFAVDALRAGALVGGVFLALLGTLRAAIRLQLLPRGELAVLLPMAIVVVLVPLGVGLKVGFRDEMPPSLRTYRHALPWSRSPLEELLGVVLGGAFWAATGIGLGALLERTVPVLAAGTIFTTILGPTLAAAALWQIHGPVWSTSRTLASVLGTLLFLAGLQLILAPRGPFGAREGLSILAREYTEAAAAFPSRPLLAQRAHDLAVQGCKAGQARACFLASFALTTHAGSSEASELFLRRACDLASSDLALCARFVGDIFSTSAPSPCSVEARCAASYGINCTAGLLGCKMNLGASGLMPVCGRREASGWREVWCAIPR